MQREPVITGPEFPQRGGPTIARTNGSGGLYTSHSDLLRADGQLENEPAMWTPEHDYQPSEDRSVIRALRACPGVVSWDDFTVTAATPASWNVVVGPGRAIIDGTVAPWLQGSYVVYAPNSRTIPVAPAHPTLDRYDLVILHVLDQENSTEEGFGWRREVVTGEPGAGDLPPELPPNSLPLRGIRVTAGSTSVTATGFWPPIWPRQVDSDFRHPAGANLQRYFLSRMTVCPPGQATKTDWFDLQVPPAWREVALWGFDVVMEITITARVFVVQDATVEWHLDPRTNSPSGVTPPGRVSSSVFAVANRQNYVCVQDAQLFEVGQAPEWALWWVSPVNAEMRVESRTVIVPRTVTTNRVTDTVEW
jgi:hypothetical protein